VSAVAAATARIPIRGDGPDSLNAAMAATVALYELGNRITRS
jgi:tRNA G18 (ribose-2'-O)-methylase SpoU